MTDFEACQAYLADAGMDVHRARFSDHVVLATKLRRDWVCFRFDAAGTYVYGANARSTHVLIAGWHRKLALEPRETGSQVRTAG